MAMFVYTGEKASRTHESIMQNEFLERLEDRWAQSDDFIYVVFNAFWNGAEIDAVCILPGMLVVVDFKSYSGTLEGTENGAWTIDGLKVKGGSKANPFLQLRGNKFAVIEWIRHRGLLLHQNTGHIAAAAVFSGPIHSNLDLSPKVRSWFHVTDLGNCAQVVDTLASPELAIRREDADAIIHTLGVTEYRWQPSRIIVHSLVRAEEQQRNSELTMHQREILDCLIEALESKRFDTITVRGMTATGKSFVLDEAAQVLARAGSNVIRLVPNARLATIQSESIYRHLYISSATEDVMGPNDAAIEKSTHPQNSKNTLHKDRRRASIIPLKVCKDPEDCVYLIDDAHLLSNEHFRLADGRLYGSGHLLDDFLDFIGGTNTSRRVVFFVDPYQIGRASKDESVVLGTYQQKRGLADLQLTIDQVVGSSAFSTRIRNAITIVEAIRAQRFSSLRLELDDSFRAIDKDHAVPQILSELRSNALSLWYLTATHKSLGEYTDWVRQKVHSASRDNPIVVGDALEGVSYWKYSKSPFDRSGSRSGDRFVNMSTSHVSGSVLQPLNGRDEPVRFTLVEELCLRGARRTHDEELIVVNRVLIEYLTSAKGEVERDVTIAVRAWAKNYCKPEPESAGQSNVSGDSGDETEFGLPGVTLLRYGYGAVVHHAQGMKHHNLLINAQRDSGKHTDDYFRWLYTALCIGSNNIRIVNYKPLHPFDSCEYRQEGGGLIDRLELGAGLRYQGVDRAVRLRALVRSRGGELIETATANYQDRFKLKLDGKEIDLTVWYNGKGVVSKIVTASLQYESTLVDMISALFMGESYSQSVNDIISYIRARCDAEYITIIGVEAAMYDVKITLQSATRNRIRIIIHFDKEGVVSSVQPLEYTHDEMVRIVREMLQ